MGIREVIAATPSLVGVSAAGLAQLVAASQTKLLPRGAYLWRTGDAADFMTIIRTGAVKVTKSVGIGRQSICGVFGAPDSVGDVAVFRAIPYPANAEVVTQTARVVVIDRSAVLSVVKSESRLALSCTKAAQDKLIALHTKIDVLTAPTIECRLARVILDLYNRFGDDLDDGTGLVPIVLSRRELADLVATSFETTIRIMSRWAQTGIVDTSSRGFVIRQASALREFSIQTGRISEKHVELSVIDDN